MPLSLRPFLLDVTRLVARAWTGRQSTGIDRVAEAYLRHFSSRALAVVQHRGIVRVLDDAESDRLFETLLKSSGSNRAALAGLATKAFMARSADWYPAGATYINIGHTDFDLPVHHDWAVHNGLRTAYFIHDLIPIRHPEMTSAHAVKRHRGRVTMPLAVALPRPDMLGAEPRDQTPFFLSIATLEPRKNHQLLLDVWRDLVENMGDAAPRLIIVGQTGPLTDATLLRSLNAPALRGKIELITDCDDARLAQLLKDARALLMPTLAEGYGLPLVEALQSGVPVIASDIPIFREISQDIPLLLDPKNRAAWGKAIAEFANESGDYARQRAAMDRFQTPRWSDHFTRLENWLALPECEASDTCLSA